MSNQEAKERLRRSVAAKLAAQGKDRPDMTAVAYVEPRYDEVFALGQQWLEGDALPARVSIDARTRAQRWADAVTSFSGSWAFIGTFGATCVAWVGANLLSGHPVDPFPFMALNGALTVVSTFQSPLILLSQNRQNEMDRERDQRAADDIAALRRDVAELSLHINKLTKDQ